MHRGTGTIIILAVSAFYVLVSFYRLLRHRFYGRFVTVLGVFAGLSLFIYFGLAWAWSFESSDLRAWVAVPFAVLIPVFLLSGFILRGHVESFIQRRLSGTITEKTAGSPTRRTLGMGLSVLGVAIWAYGIIHPFSGTSEIVALAIALYSMVLGVPYLLTGRRISEIDK